jgi:hypothetical protein
LSGIILIFLSGCASTGTSRFYTLNSINSADIKEKVSLADNSIAIGIGPVEIPDYLDRPQIVTRTSRNELKLSDFNRWAGSLKSDISRVLAKNLSALLTINNVHIYPWKLYMPVKYQIIVDITGFDGTPGGDVIFKANWTILGENGKKALLSDSSNFSEKINGQGYNALVAAESRVLERLSRDIAAAVKSLSQELPDK